MPSEAGRPRRPSSLRAEAPAAGAEFIDLKGTVTMRDGDGNEWIDYVGHRFYRDDRIRVAIAGQGGSTKGLTATLVDPEGKTVGVSTGTGAKAYFGSVDIPRRAAGYKLAVMNAQADQGAPDVYYSLGLSDLSSNSDGLAHVSFPARDLACYAYNAIAPSLHETEGDPVFGNNAPPPPGAEALTIRPGESLVSCSQSILGAKDIDWYIVKCDPAARTASLAADAAAPLASTAYQASNRGIACATLAVDAGGEPELFYYEWTGSSSGTATGLALKRSRRSSESWSTETIADLTGSAVSLATLRDLAGAIVPIEGSGGAWTVFFCSWGSASADSALALPRLAKLEAGGSWTVGDEPIVAGLGLDLSEPPLARLMGDYTLLAYRSRGQYSNSVVYRYAQAQGLQWIPGYFDIESTSASQKPAMYGMDTSGAELAVYGSKGGSFGRWSLSTASSGFSWSWRPLPEDLPKPLANPFLDFLPLSSGSLVAVQHTYPEGLRADCVALFANETGAGFSSFYVGTGESGSAPASPVQKGDYRAAVTEGGNLAVTDLATLRTRHFPALPLPSAAGTSGSASYSIGLGAAGKAFALARWYDGSSAWGYALFEEKP